MNQKIRTIQAIGAKHLQIERASQHLLGEAPEDGGHYITVWGPRQSGKSWIMRQAYRWLKAEHPKFEVQIVSLMSASPDLSEEEMLEEFNRPTGSQFWPNFSEVEKMA